MNCNYVEGGVGGLVGAVVRRPFDEFVREAQKAGDPEGRIVNGADCPVRFGTVTGEAGDFGPVLVAALVRPDDPEPGWLADDADDVGVSFSSER